MPRIEAVYFEHSGSLTNFRALARVLQYSAARQCPTWSCAVESRGQARREGGTGVLSHIVNTQKLEAWAAIVDAAPVGTELALLDVDTVIVRPLDPIWDQPFDLAYTVKPTAAPPFNLGVVFVRVTARTQRFFVAWLAENYRLFRPSPESQAWRRKYGGINQAAFGALLERGAVDLELATVPCAEWNCEDSAWETFDPAMTRVLHLKGALRMAIFRREASPALAPAFEYWRALERETHAAAASTR